MVDIELVFLIVYNRIFKDILFEVGFYYVQFVWFFFFDFEGDEDFMNVFINEDRYFVFFYFREGNLMQVWLQVFFCMYCDVFERNGEFLYSLGVVYSNVFEVLVIN